MIYLLLAWEYFKVGLFTIGGGLAALPLLFDLTDKYDWFTASQLTDMVAISESTPGPLAINMATYSGYTTAGVLGWLRSPARPGWTSCSRACVRQWPVLSPPSATACWSWPWLPTARPASPPASTGRRPSSF